MNENDSHYIFESRNKKSDGLVRGSPILFFILFLILIFILLLTLYIRRPIQNFELDNANNDNDIINKNPKKDDNINHWFEIIIPKNKETYQTEKHKVFRYPEILAKDTISNNTEEVSFTRNKLYFEASRFIGLNPTDVDFDKPKVLIIGENTAVGNAVLKKLQSKNIQCLPLKNYIHVDFSSNDTINFFTNVSLKGAIIVHQPPLFKFAKTDGSQYINDQIFNYTTGLMNFLTLRKIPVVYAVLPPYFPGNTNVDYCYGAKLVFLPHVIDSNYIYDTNNILLASLRNCLNQKETIVYDYENSRNVIDSVTANDAANFLIDQFNEFKPGRISLKGSTNITIKEALNIAIPEYLGCKIQIKTLPHKIQQVKISQNEFVIENDVKQLIKNNFIHYTEPKEKKPYFSIVVTGRNDHFAGGFEDRAQVFLNKIGEALKAVPTADMELIFVDYATDYPTNTYLDKLFTFPDQLKNRTRFIIVPPSFHEKVSLKIKTKYPFLEYVAKNIGIWRSFGEFVLTMNPDSILSFEFFECAANRNLNEGFLYQTARFCLTEDVLRSSTSDEIFQLSEEPWNHKKFQLHDNTDTFRNELYFYTNVYSFDNYLFRAGSGDFLLLSKKLWEAIGGFHEFGKNSHVDNLLQIKMLKLVTGFVRVYLPFSIVHQEHEHLNSKHLAVDNILDIFYHYLNHGRTTLFPPERDPDDWGYSTEKFDEILI